MENHTLGFEFNCPIYIVERDEKGRPTIAVLLGPKTNRIERMFVDRYCQLGNGAEQCARIAS
jgi:hypothetical protein